MAAESTDFWKTPQDYHGRQTFRIFSAGRWNACAIDLKVNLKAFWASRVRAILSFCELRREFCAFSKKSLRKKFMTWVSVASYCGKLWNLSRALRLSQSTCRALSAVFTLDKVSKESRWKPRTAKRHCAGFLISRELLCQNLSEKRCSVDFRLNEEPFPTADNYTTSYPISSPLSQSSTHSFDSGCSGMTHQTHQSGSNGGHDAMAPFNFNGEFDLFAL